MKNSKKTISEPTQPETHLNAQNWIEALPSDTGAPGKEIAELLKECVTEADIKKAKANGEVVEFETGKLWRL